VLRLMMSRLGSHLCPNGHRIGPSVATQGMEVACPVCGARFEPPSAESFAFNSYGACPACHGLGVRSEVDVATLVPDPGKTIEGGAVLPWNSGGRRLSMYAAGELGVRLDVPYRSLTEHERDVVLHGEPVKRQVTLRSGGSGRTVQLSVNYDNAVAAVERSLRSDNERTRRLVQRFLITRVCSVCHGTRLRPEAGPRRWPGRRAYRRGWDDGRRRPRPGQRDRAVAGRAPGPAEGPRAREAWLSGCVRRGCAAACQPTVRPARADWRRGRGRPPDHTRRPAVRPPAGRPASSATAG
jgi:hypothetical protein